MLTKEATSTNVPVASFSANWPVYNIFVSNEKDFSYKSLLPTHPILVRFTITHAFTICGTQVLQDIFLVDITLLSNFI